MENIMDGDTLTTPVNEELKLDSESNKNDKTDEVSVDLKYSMDLESTDVRNSSSETKQSKSCTTDSLPCDSGKNDKCTNETNSLKDYGSMSYMLNLLPKQCQKGFHSFPLMINCFDATDSYLIVGCNLDTLFLFKRKTRSFKRLKCHNTDFENITSIKMITSVELMIAAGSKNGSIIIFKIPLHSDSKDSIEKFVVKKLHRRQITTFQWSQNAMKLYSGDSSGLVACTNIVYDEHGCFSYEILRECSTIVQLDYYKRMLLVSTLMRSFVCCIEENNLIKQIGMKPRKSQGKFSAKFYMNESSKDRPEETVVYATRPNLRLWKANASGIVIETAIFKEAITKTLKSSVVLGSPNSRTTTVAFDQQMERILIFRRFVIVYSSNFIFIINPDDSTIINTFHSIHKIIDVNVNLNEIFILDCNSTIFRVSAVPDEVASYEAEVKVNDMIPDMAVLDEGLKDFAAKMNKVSQSPFFQKIKGLGKEKLENVHKLRLRNDEAIDNATEILEDSSYNVQDTNENSKTLKDSNFNSSYSSEISEETSCDTFYLNSKEKISIDGQDNISITSSTSSDFFTEPIPDYLKSKPETILAHNFTFANSDDLVFKPKKHRKKKKHQIKSDNSSVCSANGSDSFALSNTNQNTEIDEIKIVDSEISKPNFSLDINNRSSTDDLIPESIPQICDKTFVRPSQEQKEELLSKILSFDLPKNFEEKIDTTSNIDEANHSEELTIEMLSNKKCNDELKLDCFISKTPPIQSNENDEEKEQAQNTPIYQADEPTSTSENYTFSKDEPDGFSNSLSNKSKSNVDVKNSDSDSENCELVSSLFAERQNSSFDTLIDMNTEDNNKLSKYCDYWMQHEAPGQVKCLSICKKYIVCVDNRDHVFYSLFSNPGLSWYHLDFNASQVAMSPSGNVIWRLSDGIVYAAQKSSENSEKPTVTSWIEIMKNVSYIAVGENFAWVIKMSGAIYIFTNLGLVNQHCESVQSNDQTLKFSQIECSDGVVWALSSYNKLYYRNGISQNCLQGSDWVEIRSKKDLKFIKIALCIDKTGWAVDDCGILRFRFGVTLESPEGVENDWWKVYVGDYIYKDVSNLEAFRSMMGQMNPEKLMMAFQAKQLSMNLTCGSNGVWICSKGAKTLWGNNSYVIGHKFDFMKIENHPANVKWQQICAESVYQNDGIIWLVSENGKLYFVYAYGSKCYEVSLPNFNIQISCLASSTEALWLLSKSGEVWILPVNKYSNPLNSSWTCLSLYQIDDIKLTHISCCNGVVWACDKFGTVFMRVGSLCPPPSQDLTPAWISIGPSLSNSSSMLKSTFKTKQQVIQFSKVCVGSSNDMVWGIDLKNNVYARSGLTEMYHIGIDWVYVSGIQAASIAISNMAVWALSTNGSLYYRYGITNDNFQGDCWKKIPGELKFLTVTVDDEILGICTEGLLQKHNAFQVEYEGRHRAHSKNGRNILSEPSYDDGEWEVV